MKLNKTIPIAVASLLVFCSLAARAGDGTDDLRKQFEDVLGRDFKGWYFVTVPFTGAEVGKVRIDERHQSLTNKTPLVNLQSWFPADMPDQERFAILGRIIEEKEASGMDLNTDQTRKSGGAFGVTGLFRILGLHYSSNAARNLKVKISIGNIKVHQILWQEFAEKFNAHAFAPALNDALKQRDILMCFGDVTVDNYQATITVDRSSNTDLAARLDFLARHPASSTASKSKGSSGGSAGTTGGSSTALSINSDSSSGKTDLGLSAGTVAGSKLDIKVTTGGKSGKKADTNKGAGNKSGSKAADTTQQGNGAGTSTKSADSGGDSTDTANDGSSSATDATAAGDTSTKSPGGTGNSTTGPSAPAGQSDDFSVSASNGLHGTWKITMPHEVVIAFLYKTLPREPLTRGKAGSTPVTLKRNAVPVPINPGPAFEQTVRATSHATRTADLRFIKRAEKHLRHTKVPRAKKRPHPAR